MHKTLVLMIFIFLFLFLLPNSYTLDTPLEVELKNFVIEYGVYQKFLSSYDFFYYINGSGSYHILPTSFILEISKGTIWAIYNIEANQTKLEIQFYREYTFGSAYLEVSGNGFNHTIPLETGSGFSEYNFTINKGLLNLKFKLCSKNGIGRLRIGNLRIKLYNEALTLSHTAICTLNTPYCRHVIKTPALEEWGILNLPLGYSNVTIDGNGSTTKVLLSPGIKHTVIAYTRNNVDLKFYSNGIEDRYFKPGSLIDIKISPPEDGLSQIKVYRNGELIMEKEWSSDTSWSLKADELGEYEVIVEWRGDYFCAFQSRKFAITDLMVNYTLEGEPITGLEIGLMIEVKWLHNGSSAQNIVIYLDGRNSTISNGVAKFSLASESSGLRKYSLEAKVLNSSLSKSMEIAIEWIGFNVEIIEVKNGTVKDNTVTVYGTDRVTLFFSISMTNGTIPNGFPIVIEESGDETIVIDGSFSFTVVGLDKISLYIMLNDSKVKIGEYSIIFIHPGIKILLDDYYFQVGTEASFEVKIIWMHNGTPIPGVKVKLGEYETITDEQGKALLTYSGELGEHRLNLTAYLGWTTVEKPFRLVFSYLIIEGEEEIVTNSDKVETDFIVKYAHNGEPVPEALVTINERKLKTDNHGRIHVVLNASLPGEQIYRLTAEKNRLKTLNPFIVKIYRLKVLLKKMETDGLLLKKGNEFIVASAPGTSRILKITIEGEAEKLKLGSQVVKEEEGVFTFTLDFPSEIRVESEKLYLLEDGEECPLATIIIASVEPEIEKAILVSSNSTHWIIKVKIKYNPLEIPASNLTIKLLDCKTVTNENGEAVFRLERSFLEKLVVELERDPLGSSRLYNAEIGKIEKLKISYELTGSNLEPRILVDVKPPIQGIKIVTNYTEVSTGADGKASLEYKPGVILIIDPSPVEDIEKLYYAEPWLLNASLTLFGNINASFVNGKLYVKIRMKCLQPISVEDLKIYFKVLDPTGEEKFKKIETKIPLEEEIFVEEVFEIEKEGEYRVEVQAEATNIAPYTLKTSIYIEQKFKPEILAFLVIPIALIIFLYLLLRRREKEYKELEF